MTVTCATRRDATRRGTTSRGTSDTSTSDTSTSGTSTSGTDTSGTDISGMGAGQGDRRAPGSSPLSIGPLAIWPPVVLAPMAGVTNAPFRRLCRSYGGGLYVSEMITARALVEGNARTEQMVRFASDESPRSIQLYGVDPRTMTEAVRRLAGEGRVDHLDLNFGCPVAKVTRKGGGAALPAHRRLLAAIIGAAVRAAAPEHIPVTVKFRLGIDAEHLTHLATGRIAEAEGAAAIALHARTAEQQYSGAAAWDRIGELKAAVDTIPVLGNGDILEAGDALAMMAATGCDGVVVGRGCLGRPWLFADLAAAFDGRATEAWPTFGGVTEVMRAHACLLTEWFGERAGVRDFRKHTGWYLKGFPVGAERRRQCNQVATMAELDRLLRELLVEVHPRTSLPAEAVRVMRGHTHGPRRVVLPDGWWDGVDDPAPPQGAELLVSGG